PGGAKIDAHGRLPSGERFDDVQGLRRLLKGDKVDLLARNLVSRLLICATGRRLGVADNREIDRILQEHKPAGYPFKDLLFAVVTSEAFGNK
ncbi:MAG: DUF1585 domain-containing protein, partial [Planctomycetales bacterium]